MNLEVMTLLEHIYADAAGADASLGLAARKLVGKQGLPK
jgi:iron complex outermembrane receptor protein